MCLGALPGRGTDSESPAEFAEQRVQFTARPVLCARVNRAHVHTPAETEA